MVLRLGSTAWKLGSMKQRYLMGRVGECDQANRKTGNRQREEDDRGPSVEIHSEVESA